MILIKEILEKLPASSFVGNEYTYINEIKELETLENHGQELVWISDKNIDKIQKIQKATVVLSKSNISMTFSKDINYILVDNPRLYFIRLLKLFFLPTKKRSICSSSIISEYAKIGINVSIGSHNLIEENCNIGDNVTIGHNNVILNGTIISNNVVIGNNNTIGGVGFGYEKNENGEYENMPHIGKVKIYESVEIGNNTCIDKGVIGDTLIGKNTKIDNLVHIAHGVKIGENSLIIANSMIAGSTEIGKNVWVSPSVSIINKIKIGDNALLGMGAVVIKDVNHSKKVVGNPSKEI